MDIGAFQTQAQPFQVTTTADPGGIAGQLSLREAINLADALPGGGTIRFNIPTSDPGYNPATYSYTITLHSALPALTQCPDLRARNRDVDH